MDLGEKTAIQKPTCYLRSLNIHGQQCVQIFLQQPSTQASPRIWGCVFLPFLRGNCYVCVTKTEQYQGHEAAVPQAGDHFQNTACMTIFPTSAALTVSFLETLQLQGDPYLSLAKTEHFLRACLVQYVGIFSLFTLTAAHCRPHSCSIYPTGNS